MTSSLFKTRDVWSWGALSSCACSRVVFIPPCDVSLLIHPVTVPCFIIIGPLDLYHHRFHYKDTAFFSLDERVAEHEILFTGSEYTAHLWPPPTVTQSSCSWCCWWHTYSDDGAKLLHGHRLLVCERAHLRDSVFRGRESGIWFSAKLWPLPSLCDSSMGRDRRTLLSVRVFPSVGVVLAFLIETPNLSYCYFYFETPTPETSVKTC